MSLGWLWMATANSCPAVLGENEHQLEKRYGKFIPALTEHRGPIVTRFYLVRGAVVAFVMLHGGKSVCEGYTRADKQPLPEHTISAMLEGNARAEKWREIPPEKGVSRQWTIAKIKARAFYFAKGEHPGIMIFTDSWLPYARDCFQEATTAKGKPVRP